MTIGGIAACPGRPATATSLENSRRLRRDRDRRSQAETRTLPSSGLLRIRVDVRVVEDVKRLITFGVENEHLSGGCIKDCDRESVLIGAPQEHDLDAAIYPVG
jgi:hypothetical protein